MKKDYDARVREVLIRLAAELTKVQARCDALEQLVPPEQRDLERRAFDEAYQKRLESFEDVDPSLAAELDDRAPE